MTPTPPIDAPALGSPCTGVCRIDAASGRCEGCRRTLAEIAAWPELDDGARRAVWGDLPNRAPGGIDFAVRPSP